MFNNDVNNNSGDRLIFGNNLNEESNNYLSSGEEVQDLPPELDNIKNLNDFTSYDVPSMDNLGPANIMPETNSYKLNDPLSMYESGKLNFDELHNGLNNIPNVNSNTVNDITLNTNNINKDLNFLENSESSNLDKQDISLYNKEINIDNNTSQINSYNFQNTNFPFEQNDTDAYNEDTFSMNNLNNSSNSETLSPSNTSEDDNYIKSVEELYNIYKPLKFNNDDSVSNTNEPKFDINDMPKTEEKNYEIDNETNLQDEKSIDDLGLDASYNEPDMLEIMDIDEDEEKDKNSNDNNAERKEISEEVISESFENVTVKDNVEKIKKYVSDLKQQGLDAEIEEFDFESLYQIIIKINKKGDNNI